MEQGSLLQLGGFSLVAYMWDPSSPTMDQMHVSCIARWILNHWTTTKVPRLFFFLSQQLWQVKVGIIFLDYDTNKIYKKCDPSEVTQLIRGQC